MWHKPPSIQNNPAAGRSAESEHAWKILPPPGELPHYQVKISGRAALPSSALVPVPEVRVQGAVLKARWLALLGHGTAEKVDAMNIHNDMVGVPP